MSDKTLLSNMWVQSLMVVLLSFCLLLAYWKTPVFTSDEGEVFAKGLQIAKGEMIYKDFVSQHMPVIYFIAALTAVFGADSVFSFRIYFYVLIALFWGGIHLSYGKVIGRKAVLTGFAIYLCLIVYISYATSIIADVFQGLGMVILLYEVISYSKTKTLKTMNMIRISLAVFISFGSTFTAAFGILFAFVTALMIDAISIRSGESRLSESLLRYLKLALIATVPWVCMLLYFLGNGALKDFYRWAYLFNREIYSKYLYVDTMYGKIKDSYGSSIFGAMFSGLSHIGETFYIEQINTSNLVFCITVIISAAYAVHIIRMDKDKIMIVAGISLFVIACATRGAFAYHGLPFVYVISAIVAMALWNWLIPIVKENKRASIAAILISCIFLSGYLQFAQFVFSATADRYIDHNDKVYAIRAVTEKGECISCTTLDYAVLVDAGVYPVERHAGAEPWFWERIGREDIQRIRESRPRVALYNPDNSFWGYRISEYASDLVTLMDYNYVKLREDIDDVYVRKDYYYDAISRLSPGTVFTEERSAGKTEPILLSSLLRQYFICKKQEKVDEIKLLFGTYDRVNHCTVNVAIYDDTENVLKMARAIEGSEIQDQKYLTVDFEPFEVFEGHNYRIEISSDSSDPDNAVCIYRGPTNENVYYYSMMNDELKNYSLTLTLRNSEDIGSARVSL